MPTCSVLYRRNKKYEAEETSFNMFRRDDIELKTTKELENGAEGRAGRSGEDMLGGEGALAVCAQVCSGDAECLYVWYVQHLRWRWGRNTLMCPLEPPLCCTSAPRARPPL